MAAENASRPQWLRVCFKWSFFVLLFLTMVVPNSIKPVSVSVLALSAILAWPLTNFSPAFMRVVWMHVASSGVTLIFLLVGLLNGASNEALIQTLFIYIVSPALWIVVTGGVLAVFDADDLQNMMENNAIFACASVALFFYLFLNFGPEGVSFFIEPENANVNLQEGYAGATMHVYGTLIFLSSAMFAMLTAGRMDTKLLITLGLLVVAAVTSGRSALMLSIPVGLGLGAALRSGIYGQQGGTLAWNLGKQIGIAVAAGVIFIILLSAFTEVDVLYILTGFWEELSGGGGSERTGQANALFEGIISTYAMGAGHGVGVAYIRSELFPWRYEIVLLATIYRVGFIGALIYFWPFARYGWGVFETWKRHRLTNFDVFLFAGCASAFIAAATNPYIEGYTFHWMYVLPLTIFLVRHPGTSIFDARPVRREGGRIQAPRAHAGARQGMTPAQMQKMQQMQQARQMQMARQAQMQRQGYPQQAGAQQRRGQPMTREQAQAMYMAQARAAQAQRGHPQQAGMPQRGHSQQGHPQQRHSQQGHVQQGRPQQGVQPRGVPAQPGIPPQRSYPQQLTREQAQALAQAQQAQARAQGQAQGQQQAHTPRRFPPQIGRAQLTGHPQQAGQQQPGQPQGGQPQRAHPQPGHPQGVPQPGHAQHAGHPQQAGGQAPQGAQHLPAGYPPMRRDPRSGR